MLSKENNEKCVILYLGISPKLYSAALFALRKSRVDLMTFQTID